MDHDGGYIEIRSIHPQGASTTSHWLRYEDDVLVTDDSEGETREIQCRIALAYQVEAIQNPGKQKSKWKVIPLENGQVSIYFPAEKEKANLKFHIHAPFASTVARDSIRDCYANDQLRDHIAALVVRSVHDLKKRNMLNVSFLAT